MAIIYDTTMSPGKLELLAAWLPAQPWYLGTGQEPELTKAGGFRLDDPQGEVGIEFMVVTDRSGGRAATYQVPLTYRALALAGAASGLIGTAEHGVLGHRWIYDGAHDPVLVAQLVAAIQGESEPQDQNLSSTPDDTVSWQAVTDGSLTAIGSVVAANTRSGTDLRVETAPAGGELTVRINRILPSADGVASPPGQAGLSATWRLPDATQVRGVLATAQYTHVRRAPH
ncbi:MAG TPA: 1,4-alpha-glucan branching protein [Streptosporangiaceae bacterium]